jgi:hypothetical protein
MRDPCVRAGEDISCLGPRGHWDGSEVLVIILISYVIVSPYQFLSKFPQSAPVWLITTRRHGCCCMECWLVRMLFLCLFGRSYLLTDLNTSRDAANCAATQELPSILWNPEGSLPCSQQPSTGPYPEPDRSSPYDPILSKIYFNIVQLLTDENRCFQHGMT